MAGNTTKQLNFLPRKSFQPAKDDILSDCITGCKRFSHYEISLHSLHVRILRRARQVKGFRIVENWFAPLLLSQNGRARCGSMLYALEIDGRQRR
jgi:hypothetical protein